MICKAGATSCVCAALQGSTNDVWQSLSALPDLQQLTLRNDTGLAGQLHFDEPNAGSVCSLVSGSGNPTSANEFAREHQQGSPGVDLCIWMLSMAASKQIVDPFPANCPASIGDD